jgi:hypothetical protein
MTRGGTWPWRGACPSAGMGSAMRRYRKDVGGEVASKVIRRLGKLFQDAK